MPTHTLHCRYVHHLTGEETRPVEKKVDTRYSTPIETTTVFTKETTISPSKFLKLGGLGAMKQPRNYISVATDPAEVGGPYNALALGLVLGRYNVQRVRRPGADRENVERNRELRREMELLKKQRDQEDKGKQEQ